MRGLQRGSGEAGPGRVQERGSCNEGNVKLDERRSLSECAGVRREFGETGVCMELGETGDRGVRKELGDTGECSDHTDRGDLGSGDRQMDTPLM